MENKPGSSTWERSTTRRFSQWLTSPKTLKRLLITMAWAASIIALYYGVVDWRGRRAWTEYRKSYEAHVGPVEAQAYIPKPIPDDENFAATPFVQAWFKQNNDTNFLFDRDAWSGAAKMIKARPQLHSGQIYKVEYQDLAAWQEAFAAVQSDPGKHKVEFRTDKLDLALRAQAAPAVLDGLNDDAAAFDELRAASARPDARYPVIYNMENPMSIALPHLGKIKGACQRLELRACAELALGQNEKAFNDVNLMLYLADTVKDEPFLVSYLVRLACANIALTPVWEGLAEHKWTEAQLQQLQGRLGSYDFLADVQRPLNAERAVCVLGVDLLKGKGLGVLADWQSGAEGRTAKHRLNFLGRFVPSGWYDEEQLHYFQRSDSFFKSGMDVSSKRVYPSRIATMISEQNHGHQNTLMAAVFYHNFFAKLMVPPLTRLPLRSTVAQIASDQAAIACALERYRLANGQFPDNLSALIPRFINQLPNDVITGDPYKYRRTDDGRFVLYSVGWNQKDDGGVPGKDHFDETKGDWVWEYPAP